LRFRGHVLASLVATSLGGLSAAAAVPIEVHLSDCPGVDEHEIERLLAIELGFAISQRPAEGPLDVALVCTGARLEISAHDPIRNRQLTREVVLNPLEPGRDRTIALLVSQLFLTSWAEGLLERPAAPPPAAPPSPATVVARPPPPPAGPRWELGAEAGVRFRDWSAPARGERISVETARRRGAARAFVDLTFEHGSVARTAGDVTWSIGAAGLGVGWRSSRRGPLALDATALAALAYAEADGAAGSAAFTGSSSGGVIGQTALGGGPVLYAGPLRLGLALELGVTFPAATAKVAGDRDVTLGGLWGGAALTIAVTGGAP
jgi:hypothetical protein